MRLRSIRDDPELTVAVVSGGHFLSHFYLLAYPPLFPLLKPDFGINNVQAGLIVSLISLAALLQAPVGGVVDRVGARRTFLLGLAVTSLGVLLSGLSGNYLALLAFVLLSGLGQATFHPADYAMIDAVTDEATKGRAFSAHVFGGFVGFAAAPLVVGTLGVAYGWAPALLVAGAIGLVYAAAAAVVLEPVYLRHLEHESADAAGAGAGSLREDLAAVLRPAILAVFLFFLVLAMAEKGIQAFTSVLVSDAFALGTAVANTTLTAYFAFASVGILVGGVLADRYPPQRVILAALAVAAALTWLVVSGLVSSAALPTVGLFAGMGIATGLVYPSRDRLVTAVSSAGSTGKSFGFVFTGLSLGGLLSPVLLGVVIDASGARAAFAIVGGCFLLATVIAFVAAAAGD